MARGFLQVALDWTGRDGYTQNWLTRRAYGYTQNWLTRRAYGYTRTRVKGTGRPWEVEFYCDEHGRVEVRDARTGRVLFSHTMEASAQQTIDAANLLRRS